LTRPRRISRDRSSSTSSSQSRAPSIWLHGKDLKVSEAYVTDSRSQRIAATYSEKLESGVALLSLAEALPAGPARLHLIFSAPFNTSSNALFKVVRGERAYAVTQFEAIAARQAFPSFDEPGFKTPFDVAITARKGDVVVTTTPESEQKDLGNGSVRHVFRTTRPASYLPDRVRGRPLRRRRHRARPAERGP
jgi:alanyl aminopeptidase